MRPLEGIRILTLALNLPGPLAVAHLVELGATATKIEPPAGDPLAHARPDWYQNLHRGQSLLTLDLKDPDSRPRLEELLGASDLLLTAMRPAALRRLGLDGPALRAGHPRLCQVAILGYPPPHEDLPGHDLTFQARAGLLEPPHLPRVCVADFAGAERAVSAALTLLLARARGQPAGYAQVGLAEAADAFADPWRQGLTTPGGILGGAHAGYNLYGTRAGWLALAALEPHFQQKLTAELGLPADADRDQLEQAFLTRTAVEWETWAAERGLPLVAVRGDRP